MGVRGYSVQPSAHSHQLTDCWRADSILFTSSTASSNSENLDSDRYFKSLDSISWYSSSDADPKAIFKNLPNCGSEFLPHPSAMFVGIEEADRRICEIKPYSSSFGYILVSTYISNTSRWDFSHTFKFLKFFIPKYLFEKADSCQLKAERLSLDHSHTNSLQKNLKQQHTNHTDS